ncbi:efflux RND transporter periplasmic adaptor subunit [Azotobacter vinelandii]|uniref:efflux RND transporter periplasmic adaptor subunit n=1 Tax=Azotobacter vinelandii TaxID=354 RepID=UPI0026656C03|nr:HlyD family efflux transporter periplasmic adaptor subunit [Azotobacter vinelandii]WKN23782.1 efflux RND transporter periplasmic adaptor subunit [Azotobacter vinelandii]
MKANFLIFAACLSLGAPALADDGHDHGEAAPVANANGPQRLPDGSVFLPKPAQRQLGVRTLPVSLDELPRSFELSGKVVMDPNAGGRVQAMLAGRLEAGPRGLPGIGQTVKKGEVLAHVVASSDVLERANQAAQLAQLRAARQLAEQRVARLRELSDTVPRKDIEAAASEVASLAAQIAALGAGAGAREALVAPVSGVIASASAVAGQVVGAGELIFEVIDPTRLRVEALVYDPQQAADVAGASLAVGGERVPLTFVGSARSLREQALPMLFQGEGEALARLAVGQAVRVFVQSASRVSGIRVPAASLMKNAANQNVVWVKNAPERFEPRVVVFAVLDGASVAVTAGLQAGERVVIQAAGLLNQIR